MLDITNRFPRRPRAAVFLAALGLSLALGGCGGGLATVIETRTLDGDQVAVSTIDPPAETTRGYVAPLARLAIVRADYPHGEATPIEASSPSAAETNPLPESVVYSGDPVEVSPPIPSNSAKIDATQFQESAAGDGFGERAETSAPSVTTKDLVPEPTPVASIADAPRFRQGAAQTASQSPPPTRVPSPTAAPTLPPSPTPTPTRPPEPTPSPTPEPTQPPPPTPTTPPDPPPPSNGPVLVAKAKSTTGEVETFDRAGNPSPVRYRYLDGREIDYGLRNPTFFGGTLYLQVVNGTPQDEFVEVLMPVRPAGTTGWVRSDAFEFFSSSYSIEVNVTTNVVRVWDGHALVAETRAVTGRSDRPTPLARTYVDEILPGPNAAYGPKMLTLALFSESLNTFSDSLPKIAIHGTNQPELMGSYASSGCIRIPNNIIEHLASVVPPGTPVTIVG